MRTAQSERIATVLTAVFLMAVVVFVAGLVVQGTGITDGLVEPLRPWAGTGASAGTWLWQWAVLLTALFVAIGLLGQPAESQATRTGPPAANADETEEQPSAISEIVPPRDLGDQRVAGQKDAPAASEQTSMELFFSSLVEEIEAGYDRLGHKHGWRFLYTPRKTLSPTTRLATLGINPGGGHWEKPRPSVEAGSAYRIEKWPGVTLQAQIQLLYDEVARKVGAPSPEQLMDATLAANFYPFRSSREGRLKNEVASREFSRELWGKILRHVNPRVWICFGATPAEELKRLLPATGGRRVGVAEKRPVGWASWTYELLRYDSPRGRTLLVRLPHLSYPIFGRSPSQEAFQRITSAIAAAMTGTD